MSYIEKININECHIKEVDKNEAIDFLKDNSLIKFEFKADLYLGIYTSKKYYTDSILIAVIMLDFYKNSILMSNYNELLGYIILNEFDKIIKYFKENYEYDELLYIQDRRFYNVYLNKYKIYKELEPKEWKFKNKEIVNDDNIHNSIYDCGYLLYDLGEVN